MNPHEMIPLDLNPERLTRVEAVTLAREWAAPPKLAICNFMEDVDELKHLALGCGFSGVDWTFKLESLPRTPLDEARFLRSIEKLDPLEVRYHCAFTGIDMGDEDPGRASSAFETFTRTCELVSKVGGRYITLHIGLGRSKTSGLIWERSIRSLRELVDFARDLGITICLENLATGWSSRPELFEKLVRKSGAAVTLDIGHAFVSPSVECELYAFEDFVAPQADRVMNAHVYHEEREGKHVPPASPEDFASRLDLLTAIGCRWWVLELRELAPLLKTVEVMRRYLDGAFPTVAAGPGLVP